MYILYYSYFLIEITIIIQQSQIGSLSLLTHCIIFTDPYITLIIQKETLKNKHINKKGFYCCWPKQPSLADWSPLAVLKHQEENVLKVWKWTGLVTSSHSHYVWGACLSSVWIHCNRDNTYDGLKEAKAAQDLEQFIQTTPCFIAESHL